MLHTVVMAGGSGTRFWPQSRNAMPKQLLKLVGDRTMIQATAERCSQLADNHPVWVVTNKALAEEIRNQLPHIPDDQILIEPAPRNTAPCIGLAAVHLSKQDPEAIMLVASSDHVIRPDSGFVNTINQATTLIEEKPDTLALIGVPPTRPATGFGYIQCGQTLNASHSNCFQVQEFKEKPDSKTAQQYLDDGNYLWNCGIFVWKVRTILSAFSRWEPEIYKYLMQISDGIGTPQYDEVLKQSFPEMKSESIDYAILEKSKDNLAVIQADFEWDDVGNWNQLQKYYPIDADGNTILGAHCGLETSNNIIRTTDDHLIATFGVENCLIVHTPDATLIVPKDDEAAIKKLVTLIKERGYERFL
ncbi:MAG: mannose-1-phosphate guanylyltransferase [Planctomycetes bacterium]|nr:mannose-1-phosphate guanylyltransferase [Planctomycetota bacterium]MCH9724447.1 mannose-1-phosphate guanylyltransferase [Planctomycetota bacterium]MCH9778189.1 mannose-1-phosphate guanylyltransferase [Planctomycetota bacterium]MCH9793400.1 mannose-1-phosphate guanylyltransferase [Planctomycetota bacterium]